MKRVLGIGHALVDLLIQMEDDKLLKELGLPRGSMTLINEKEAEQIFHMVKSQNVPKASGGSAANTIHGLASLGSPVGYIGKVQNDELGKFFENDLKQAGIDAKLYRGNAGTGHANTFISPDSERTFATYLGAAVEMKADEISSEEFAPYHIVHIEGYLIYNTGLIEKAIRLAKANNMLVSLDLASFNVVEENLEFLQSIIPESIDIVFANEEEAKAYTGKEPKEALELIAGQCKYAIVKTGKEGSYIKHNNEVTKIEIIETTALDTTGAGDAYAAGFLHGLNLDLPMQKCGDLGALLAGTVIARYGARIYPEDLASVLERAKAIINN
ncbi:MAG: adenosine kinase [Bacteroidales bacterium]|nr:adenosine kinase [Bacteroidales bacterium]MBN2820848.1 adenosine kinase [Bacteroidales bacterium]